MRIKHTSNCGLFSGKEMEAGENESRASFYRVLVDRFRSLEASHAKLREQLDLLREMRSGCEEVMSDIGLRYLKNYKLRNPYRSVLDSVGHAICVSSASSNEIIYWNLSAYKLFGWKENEVVGQRAIDLLIDEEYRPTFNEIWEGLCLGKCWSGQFPLKKRSGEIFMAIMTKSPLYEDGALIGVTTVSSDAAVFNSISSEQTQSRYQGSANARSGVRGFNPKEIQWHLRPQIAIASVPEIASSVSNLASKALSLKRENSTYNGATSEDDEEMVPKGKVKMENLGTIQAESDFGLHSENGTMEGSFQKDASMFAQPSKLVSKFLSKLQIRGNDNSGSGTNGNTHLDSSTDTLVSKEGRYESNSPQGSKAMTSFCDAIDIKDKRERIQESGSAFVTERPCSDVTRCKISSCLPILVSSRECPQCFLEPKAEIAMPLLFHMKGNDSMPEMQNFKAAGVEEEGQRQSDVKKGPSSGESISSIDGRDDDSNTKIDYEIVWEDLNLGKQIGEGYLKIAHFVRKPLNLETLIS